MTQELDQLYKDFLYFGALHSYYKHIPIYGRQYYFYRTKGLQPRLNIISYDDNNKLYIRAYNAGKAPKIIPESTNSIALKYTTLDILKKYF